MPSILPGEGITKQGLVDEAALIVGPWQQIGLIAGGEIELGAVADAVLNLSREEYRYMNPNAFPMRVAASVAVQVGMTFTGILHELHKENIHFLAGDAVDDSSNYMYWGERKDCYFASLSAKRTRICDGRTLEAFLYKVKTTDAISLAGAQEANGMALNAEALDDVDGSFGSPQTGALGYVYSFDKNS